MDEKDIRELDSNLVPFKGRFVTVLRGDGQKCPNCNVVQNVFITCPACEPVTTSCFHSIGALMVHFGYYKDEPLHSRMDPFKEMSIDQLNGILGSTVRKDEVSKAIIFLAMLLAQSKNKQFNIIPSGRSSTGKTYLALQICVYFPVREILIYSGATPTAFFHEKGEQVIEKENEFVRLEDELEPLVEKLEQTKNRDERRRIKREMARLYGEAKILVDLKQKILIFTDQPHVKLLEKMRPIFSHDQAYIEVPITDSLGRGGKRTKHVILMGFSSVIFCTTFSNLNEQESTRNFIVSPDNSQEKIGEALELLDQKLANEGQFHDWLDSDPARKALQFRIELIRCAGFDSFVCKPGVVLQKYRKSHQFYMSRAPRDFTRIYSLVYGHALLNAFQRMREDPRTLIADETKDVDAAFKLYEPIAEANESGISPDLFNFYKDVLCPVYLSKNLNHDFLAGVSYAELGIQYRRKYHQTIDREKLRNYLEALIGAGYVESLPDPDDKRKPLFTPLQSEIDSKHNFTQNDFQHTLEEDMKQKVDRLEATLRKNLHYELIERTEERDGGIYVKCKDHKEKDQWFAFPDQWLDHVRIEHKSRTKDNLQLSNEFSRLMKSVTEKGDRETALEIFKKLSGDDKQSVEDKSFYEELEKTGKFTRERSETILSDFWKSGVIFEVKAHFFKKA